MKALSKECLEEMKQDPVAFVEEMFPEIGILDWQKRVLRSCIITEGKISLLTRRDRLYGIFIDENLETGEESVLLLR